MKILLLYDTKGSKAKNLMLELEKNSNKIIYWVGAPGGEIDNLPESIFHSSSDALLGLPAKNINISEFAPPSNNLIEKLYRTESLILTMMNAKYDNLRTSERKHLYYEMLRYWYGILNKYKPDVVLHGLIPHAVHTFLIQELARLLNIKTVMFEDTGASDRLLAFNDFRDGSKDLQREIKRNHGKNFSLKDLSNDIQKYYKSQLDFKHDSTPVYVGVLKNRYTGSELLKRRLNRFRKSIQEGIFLKTIIQTIIKRFRKNSKDEYASLQAEPDLNKKFIYAPLHLQPECTTSPKGDLFVDQILMLETLSAALPKDWVIYVKEHPIQWYQRGTDFSGARYRGYYKKISEIKNIQLIPVQISTYTLINKSQAVATVAGMASWEAVLRSKPAIIFGYSWYRDCYGVFKVDNIYSCSVALEKIASGFAVDQQQVINYLKCFDDATIHGYLDVDYAKSSELTPEENKNNVIQKMLFEIKN
ncbi:MAG TPA: hypothetical protein VMW82_02805 [Candidatus Paceibacterota bacterium]|nr:hypothetical protein [Candidatus Paceibacterota bacterium]